MRFGVRLASCLFCVLAIVSGDASAANPYLKKSDVAFPYPAWNNDPPQDWIYSDYGANKMLWGFLPPTYGNYSAGQHATMMNNYVNGLQNHQSINVDFAARIEWDVVWNGMTAQYPATYQDAFAKDFDGNSIDIPWFPGHKFFSSHHSTFRSYLEWQVEDVAFYGSAVPESILFDSQQSLPALYQRGAGFNAHTQADFVQWLDDGYTTGELAGLGINNINTFAYRDHLVALGWNRSSYNNAVKNVPNNVPLSNEFRLFMQQANNQHVGDLAQFAKNVAVQQGFQGEISVGISAPVLDPYYKGIRFVDNDSIDYYVQEFNHRADLNQPASQVMIMYKMADALGKPVALTGQPSPDWYTMALNPSRVDLIRTWIAQAYSNGANFMVPNAMWSYSETQPGNPYYYLTPGELEPIYNFVADNSELFDDYEAVANVGLVYVHNAYRNNSLDVYIAAGELMQQNIPFELLIAGDEWWPKTLADADQSNRLQELSVVVETNATSQYIDSAQQTILDGVSSKTVTWNNNDLSALLNLLDREIDVSAGDVAAFPRMHASDPNAPSVLHLVNRNYSSSTSTLTSQSNFTVTLTDQLFDGEIQSALYHRPGASPLNLLVTDGNGDVTITIPNLSDWGVLELSTSAATLVGDFNGDGNVDGADFLAWQSGEVSNPPSSSDLADWQANYGGSGPPDPPDPPSSTVVHQHSFTGNNGSTWANPPWNAWYQTPGASVSLEGNSGRIFNGGTTNSNEQTALILEFNLDDDTNPGNSLNLDLVTFSFDVTRDGAKSVPTSYGLGFYAYDLDGLNPNFTNDDALGDNNFMNGFLDANPDTLAHYDIVMNMSGATVEGLASGGYRILLDGVQIAELGIVTTGVGGYNDGIDTWGFRSFGGGEWNIDNFIVRSGYYVQTLVAASSAVPEPSTAVLLVLAGLLNLGASRRPM